MLAQLCYQLQLFDECAQALLPADAAYPNGGAAGWLTLGFVRRRTNRQTDASVCFEHAVTLDPMLWTAWEQLNILGKHQRAQSLMRCVKPDEREHPIMLAPMLSEGHVRAQSLHQAGPASYEQNVAAHVSTPAHRTPVSHTPGSQRTQWQQQGDLLSRQCTDSTQPQSASASHANRTQETAQNTMLPPQNLQAEPAEEDLTTPTPSQRDVGGAQPPGAPRARQQIEIQGYESPSREAHDRSGGEPEYSGPHPRIMVTEEDDDARRRKVSSKLFNENGSNGRATSQQHASAPLQRDSEEDLKEKHGGSTHDAQSTPSNVLQSAFSILSACEMGYRLLSEYKCQEALNVLNSLPHPLCRTGWVLHHVRAA